MGLKVMGCEGVDWVDLPPGGDSWTESFEHGY